MLFGGRSIGKTELPHTLLCTGRTPNRMRKHAAAEILRGEGCGESAVTENFTFSADFALRGARGIMSDRRGEQI